MILVATGRRRRLSAVSVTIVPEPDEAEREAILAALGSAPEAVLGAWEEAALREGVEGSEPDP